MMRVILSLLLLTVCLPVILSAQQLSEKEMAIIAAVDKEAPEAVTLLEQLVNINSGTFHPSGVIETGKILERQFQSLGFTTHWVPMESVNRAPHLVAERKGTKGKRLLLIGHMDTVFEPTSPFQRFERKGDLASGPGTSDMKGGLVVLLSALKALNGVGGLDNVSITIFLTADEESAGEPTEISRKEFIATAKVSDALLSFETGIRKDGKDYVSTARRGSTYWEIKARGISAHSGGIFSQATGDGAIFELSRILNLFHDTLREPNLTYSAGLALGGSNIKVNADGDATVSGKVNIVPSEALAIGDIRAPTPEQIARVKNKMQSIVARSLPGTSAEIKFNDKYPAMASTPGNVKLLEVLNEVNTALKVPQVEALDPMLRGGGDASFVAPYVSVLDGLGAVGSGGHAPGETADLSRMPLQSKRSALLIYRLTR